MDSYLFNRTHVVVWITHTHTYRGNHTCTIPGTHPPTNQGGGGRPGAVLHSSYTTSTSFGMVVLIHLPYQSDKPCVCPNRRSYLGFLSQDAYGYPSLFVCVQASVLFQHLPIDVVTRPGYVQGTLAVPNVQIYPAARFLAPDPDVQP